VEIDSNQLEWQCSCGEKRPPSHGAYISLTRDKANKKHKQKLVNKGTGEVLATSRPEAMSKGIPPLRKEQPLPLLFPSIQFSIRAVNRERRAKSEAAE